MSEPNWAELRRQFPMLETWTYLDTARKAPLPLCVEQATRDFFKDVNENAGDEVWNPASVEKTRAVHLDRGILGVRGAESEGVMFCAARGESMNNPGNGRQGGFRKDRYLRDAICL